jgi:hypothetical protein
MDRMNERPAGKMQSHPVYPAHLVQIRGNMRDAAEEKAERRSLRQDKQDVQDE